MKENTQEAIQAKQDIQELFREKEKQIGQCRLEQDRLKKKVKAALHAHRQAIQRHKPTLDEEMLDVLLEAEDALQTVLDGLEKVLSPSIDQLKDYNLANCDERIKEAANYKVGQAELEKLLQEKVDRGESLTSYLVGGSYAIRRAAKTVMKKVKDK